VKSIKVDFKTKNATVEFDESVISSQEIARAFGDTRHMMGGNMQYGAALVLSVSGLKDEATGKKAKDALAKVEGVSKVTPFPQHGAVAVEFADNYYCPMHPTAKQPASTAKNPVPRCQVCNMRLEPLKVTTKALIEALAKAGLKASHYGSGESKKTSAAPRPTGEHEGMAMNGRGNGGHAGMRMGMRGRSMMCGCAMCMEMMGMGDMEGMGEDVAPASRSTKSSPLTARASYVRSAGCGCCR
jgi:copper chaperone CopZ